FTRHRSREGRLGFGGTVAADATSAEDAAVLAALAEERRDWCAKTDCDVEPPRLLLRADRALDAARVASLLPALTAAGFTRIDLGAAAMDPPQ
ncbi:MAG: hypothetical protein ACK40I_00095, partial [Tabrizicola sp.]